MIYWFGLLSDLYGLPIQLGQTLAGLRTKKIGLEFRIFNRFVSRTSPQRSDVATL